MARGRRNYLVLKIKQIDTNGIKLKTDRVFFGYCFFAHLKRLAIFNCIVYLL